MSCSLQYIKSQSEKVIILDKIMQNCILKLIEQITWVNFLRSAVLPFALSVCQRKNIYIKNSKKLVVKEEAKENKFKGTLHCVISNYRRSIQNIKMQ